MKKLEALNLSHFHAGHRVCCAVSGGADSTALLLALHEANQEKEGLGLVLSAVHVHHGLREAEADRDAAFVQTLCQTLGIPLTSFRVDTRQRQQDQGEGVEDAARKLRYGCFAQLLAENRTDVIVTAHTLDDQAETVMMKLLRGAWTEGLAGIAPAADLAQTLDPTAREGRAAPQPNLVRPLLQVSRAAIEAFLHERHQAWCEDASNTDPALTRSRIRHELMPLLRTFNPSIAGTLARTADLARDEESYLQTEASRLLSTLALPGKPVRGGGRAVSTGVGEASLALEIERLKALPAALARRVLRAAALRLGCRPGAEDTAKLLALAGLRAMPGLSPRNGTRLELAAGLRAERSLREIRLSRVDPGTITKKV